MRDYHHCHKLKVNICTDSPCSITTTRSATISDKDRAEQMAVTTGPRNSHGYRIPIWVLGNLFAFTTGRDASCDRMIIIFKLSCCFAMSEWGSQQGRARVTGVSLPTRIPSPSPSVYSPRHPLSCTPTHSPQPIWLSSGTLPDLPSTSHTLPQPFLASLHVMTLACAHAHHSAPHSEQPLACLQANFLPPSPLTLVVGN